MVTVRLLGLAYGPRTRFDGKFLIEYDPTRQPDRGLVEFGHLVVTEHQSQARKFATVWEAREYYRACSGRLRRDGEPDRPLTEFTAQFEW